MALRSDGPDGKGMLKIGELAERAGVTVRTLHHYDEIGLLVPSFRSEAGHRFYGEGEVARLLGIRALQALGFSLEEIRSLHAGRGDVVASSVEKLVTRMRQEVIDRQRAFSRVEAVSKLLTERKAVALDDLFQAFEEIAMFEKYYTPEQLAQLEERHKAIGPERIQQVQREWEEVFQGFRDAIARDADPAEPEIQALVERSEGLIREFTGGDAGIHRSLSNLWQGEPAVRRRHGMDDDLAAYMQRAREARPERS